MAKCDKLKKLIKTLGGEPPCTDSISDCLDALCGCNIGGSGGGAGGADWNASEGEPGHVLNRTHWEEANEEIVGEYTGNWTIAETQGKRVKNAKLEENKEYKVVFDGDIHYLTAAYNENDEVVYIGATYNYDDGCYDYNAFPFVAEYDADNESISIYVSSIGTHSIKISIETKTIKRLDEQFMPLLTSPNGTKYLLSVADDGTLSATPTT